MSLHSPIDNEKSDAVMPAWIAGIRLATMLPETSMSTWIPALHGWNDAVEHLLEFDRRHATRFQRRSLQEFPDTHTEALRTV